MKDTDCVCDEDKGFHADFLRDQVSHFAKQNKLWSVSSLVVLAILRVRDLPLVKSELESFVDFLKKTEPSKKTHYIELLDWTRPINVYTNDMICNYESVSKNSASDLNNPMLGLWIEIHDLLSDITWSPLLKSDATERHHASAKARCDAMIKEIEGSLLIATHIADNMPTGTNEDDFQPTDKKVEDPLFDLLEKADDESVNDICKKNLTTNSKLFLLKVNTLEIVPVYYWYFSESLNVFNLDREMFNPKQDVKLSCTFSTMNLGKLIKDGKLADSKELCFTNELSALIALESILNENVSKVKEKIKVIENQM